MSSSSRLSMEVCFSLHGQAGYTDDCLSCVQRACPRDH